MNFWCVAKIDKHDKSIKTLIEANEKFLLMYKEGNEHIYKLFSDILKIFKGDEEDDKSIFS